jgi:hypothetical protein
MCAPPYCDRYHAQGLIKNPKIPVNPAHRKSSGVGQGGMKPLLSGKQIEHGIVIKHFIKQFF